MYKLNCSLRKKIQSVQQTRIGILFAILSTAPFAFGQEIIEDENWIGRIENGIAPFLLYRSDVFAKQDLISAKEKYAKLQASAASEWEGRYDLSGQLSDTKLVWNKESGFVAYYVYTCMIELRALNFGNVDEFADHLVFRSQKLSPPFSFFDSQTSKSFVKVKWGERRYLVPEDELETFAELAAGHYGSGKMVQHTSQDGETYEYEKGIWDSYWQRVDGKLSHVFGIPVFPAKFQRLVKQPFETTIGSVGRYEKDPATDEPFATYSRQYLSIQMGSRDGIKMGMKFYVPDLKERVTVTKVSAKTSTAVLERGLDSDTREDSCQENWEPAPCKVPKKGMVAKTIPDELLDHGVR